MTNTPISIALLSVALGCTPAANNVVDDTDSAASTGTSSGTTAGTTAGTTGASTGDSGQSGTTTGGSGGTAAGSSGNGSSGGAVGPEDCHESIVGWDLGSMMLEEAVVMEVNLVRMAGADCGASGLFEPTDPVTMRPRLQCAGRLHSLLMATAGSVGFDTPGGPLGDDLFETVAGSGYAGMFLSGAISMGQPTAKEFIESVMADDTICASLMAPEAVHAGAGHAADATDPYWTVLLGGG